MSTVDSVYTPPSYQILDASSSRKSRSYAIVGAGDTVTLPQIRKFLSCQNGAFYQKALQYQQYYMGEIRDWTEIVFSTANKDQETACCARCFFEKLPDGSTKFRHYLYTTNDPLCADNFNTYRQALGNSMALGKSVEQASFCEDKVRQALALVDMSKEEIFETFMTSASIKPMVLRTLLGDELTAGVKKTESNESVDEELRQIRDVMKDISPVDFYSIYQVWGNSKLHLRTNLPPFKAYKSVGREVALNKRAMDRWMQISFIAVLSRRWLALLSSPMEARLFCLTPDHYTEGSKDDHVWALKLADKKLGDPFFETLEGRGFIFGGLEKVACRQYGWLETLKNYCDAGTAEGDELAFKFLTVDTSKLTQKLGLTQTLMKELWTGAITFSDRLISKLQETYLAYGIQLCDFRPLNLVASELGSDFDILTSIGVDSA